MHAVDTNVLVRLITRDDEKQVGIAEAFIGRGVRVLPLGTFDRQLSRLDGAQRL